MKDFLCVCIASLLIYFCSQSLFAADDGDYWLQRNISIGDGKNQYGKKVYGSAARSVMESVPIKDSTQDQVRQLIKRSIAADKPTASKVGSSMLKRIYSPQALVGTAAVTGLLSAIGWVMEDGVYVKKVPIDPDNTAYDFAPSHAPNEKFPTPSAACHRYAQLIESYGYYSTSAKSYTGMPNPSCTVQRKDSPTDKDYISSTYPLIATPSGAEQQYKTVPLTAALLGAAMLGSQYTDPNHDFNNDRVNTGDYTGVKEIYEHDPSGVGDELADAMDDKLKNAKPTDDKKSSYIGDPKYDDKNLADNDKTSDRSWTEDGDEATGGIDPEKDPVTGEPTGKQSISLQFPLFCSWASKMCAWYDDWKVSDKVYKDHMKKTEEHQTSEKSFWQTVKDWFTWSKDDSDLPAKDDSELDVTTPFEEKKKDISWAAECPAPLYETVSFHGYTTQLKVQDYSFLCSIDWIIKPFTIGLASVLSIFIIFGFNRGSED